MRLVRKLDLHLIFFIFYFLLTVANFFVTAVSKEDSEDHNHGKLPYNGYSDEFLDRLEPNGNIPPGKGDIRYGEYTNKKTTPKPRKTLSLVRNGFFLFYFPSIGSVSEFRNWNNVSDHDRVKRQLSVSSDSKLLDDDIREEARVILRPKKPPRPKSEVLLNQGSEHRRTKRYSAFGVSTTFFF